MTTEEGPTNYTQAQCFLCTKTFQSVQNPPDLELEDSRWVVQRQLTFLYILSKLLEVPVEDCVDYLEKFSNAAEWMSVCVDCSLLVDEGRQINKDIEYLERRHRQIGQQLKQKLRLGLGEEDDEGEAIFGQVTREMRQYLRQFDNGGNFQVRHDPNMDVYENYEEGNNVYEERDSVHEEEDNVHEEEDNVHEEGNNVYEEGNNVYEEGNNVYEAGNTVYEEEDIVHEEENNVHEEGNNVYEEGDNVHEEEDIVHESGDNVQEPSDKNCTENIPMLEENVENEEIHSTNEDSEENESIPEKIGQDVEVPMKQNENSDPLGECVNILSKISQEEIETGLRRSSRTPKKSAKLLASENDKIPEPKVKRCRRKHQKNKKTSEDLKEAAILEAFQWFAGPSRRSRGVKTKGNVHEEGDTVHEEGDNVQGEGDNVHEEGDNAYEAWFAIPARRSRGVKRKRENLDSDSNDNKVCKVSASTSSDLSSSSSATLQGSEQGNKVSQTETISNPPPEEINMERSHQICGTVTQNSPNREELQHQLGKPLPVPSFTKTYIQQSSSQQFEIAQSSNCPELNPGVPAVLGGNQRFDQLSPPPEPIDSFSEIEVRQVTYIWTQNVKRLRTKEKNRKLKQKFPKLHKALTKNENDTTDQDQSEMSEVSSSQLQPDSDINFGYEPSTCQ